MTDKLRSEALNIIKQQMSEDGVFDFFFVSGAWGVFYKKVKGGGLDKGLFSLQEYEYKNVERIVRPESKEVLSRFFTKAEMNHLEDLLDLLKQRISGIMFRYMSSLIEGLVEDDLGFDWRRYRP